MRALDHSNIVKLFEVMETGTVYPIMEVVGKSYSITQWIITAGKRKRPQANSAKECLLHSITTKRVLSIYLKAGNQLLETDMNIKVADFGYSNEFPFGNKLDALCGSFLITPWNSFQSQK